MIASFIFTSFMVLKLITLLLSHSLSHSWIGKPTVDAGYPGWPMLDSVTPGNPSQTKLNSLHVTGQISKIHSPLFGLYQLLRITLSGFITMSPHYTHC